MSHIDDIKRLLGAVDPFDAHVSSAHLYEQQHGLLSLLGRRVKVREDFPAHTEFDEIRQYQGKVGTIFDVYEPDKEQDEAYLGVTFGGDIESYTFYAEELELAP